MLKLPQWSEFCIQWFCILKLFACLVHNFLKFGRFKTYKCPCNTATYWSALSLVMLATNSTQTGRFSPGAHQLRANRILQLMWRNQALHQNFALSGALAPDAGCQHSNDWMWADTLHCHLPISCHTGPVDGCLWEWNNLLDENRRFAPPPSQQFFQWIVGPPYV